MGGPQGGLQWPTGGAEEGEWATPGLLVAFALVSAPGQEWPWGWGGGQLLPGCLS